jgi:hypothetical protein
LRIVDSTLPPGSCPFPLPFPIAIDPRPIEVPGPELWHPG